MKRMAKSMSVILVSLLAPICTTIKEIFMNVTLQEIRIPVDHSFIQGTLSLVSNCRGGRPDLAGSYLAQVKAPTLLVVGELDTDVIELNEQAYNLMHCQKELVLVPGATHLFEEDDTLAHAAQLSLDWFSEYLG